MSTFIVGREGNQPFKIEATAACVSRKHLQVDVPDSWEGEWVITDLNSSNGTYVQQEDGTFQQLQGSMRAHWYTVVQLGPSNMKGYRFWLCQLAQQEPNDFAMQFQVLAQWVEQMQQDMETLKAKQSKHGVLKSVGGIAASMAAGAAGMAVGMPGSALVGRSVFSMLAGRKGSQKTDMELLKEHYARLLVCPRGNCCRPLSVHDIEYGRCPLCKAHM